MRLKLQIFRKLEFLNAPPPQIKEMTQDDQPQHSRQSADDPPAQQSHVDCAHFLHVYAVEVDHVKEVKHNGNAHP